MFDLNINHMRFFILILAMLTIKVSLGQSEDQKNLITERAQNKLENILTKLENKGFSGSILIAHGDRIIHSKGYGFSDLNINQRNSPTTAFDIGSLAKQFTAAAILKLEVQGRLNVNDKISKYFKGLPADLQEIQIHHLLTHSAGFQGAIGNDYDKISKAEFIIQAFETANRIEPGSIHEYSNVGYSLLSLIIEQVSGDTYEAYLKQYLFDPAGMKNTGYVLPKWEPNTIANGYSKNKEWGKPNEKPWDSDGPYLHLKGNGGILSTVEDLFSWHLALLGEEMLSEDAKSKYYGKHIEEQPGDPAFYGYGWVIIPSRRGTDIITHNGGNGIFFADFWRLLDEELTIILLSNNASRCPEDLAVKLARTILN